MRRRTSRCVKSCRKRSLSRCLTHGGLLVKPPCLTCGSKANLSPLKRKAILSPMDGRIVLNRAEQGRVTVLYHLDSGALVNCEAAALLGISVRQVQGLHNATKGSPPWLTATVTDQPTTRSIPPSRPEWSSWPEMSYKGFNHQHLTEMLAENDGIHLSRPTVRRILLQAGISSPRRRRAPKHPAPARPLSQGRHAAAAGCQPPRLARGSRTLPEPGWLHR